MAPWGGYLSIEIRILRFHRVMKNASLLLMSVKPGWVLIDSKPKLRLFNNHRLLKPQNSDFGIYIYILFLSKDQGR